MYHYYRIASHSPSQHHHQLTHATDCRQTRSKEYSHSRAGFRHPHKTHNGKDMKRKTKVQFVLESRRCHTFYAIQIRMSALRCSCFTSRRSRRFFFLRSVRSDFPSAAGSETRMSKKALLPLTSYLLHLTSYLATPLFGLPGKRMQARDTHRP